MQRASLPLIALIALMAVAVSVVFAGCDLLAPPPVLDGGSRDGGEEGEGEEGEGEEGEGEEGEGEGEGGTGEGEGEGGVGEGEGEGEGEARGAGTLLVQLIWGIDNDLDVRGIRQNANQAFCAPVSFFDNNVDTPAFGPLATTCTPDDFACSASVCRTSSLDRPDWDRDGAASDGDPAIDVDDVDGSGPENLNVVDIGDGDYLFGVFAYDAGTVGDCASMRLFIGGSLALETQLGVQSGDWAEVALVSVRGGSATVTALTTTACPATP